MTTCSLSLLLHEDISACHNGTKRVNHMIWRGPLAVDMLYLQVLFMVSVQLTAGLVANSVNVVIFSIFHIWRLHLLTSKLCELGHNLCNVHHERLRREFPLNITPKIWVPPLKFDITEVPRSAIQESRGK